MILHRAVRVQESENTIGRKLSCDESLCTALKGLIFLYKNLIVNTTVYVKKI